MNLFSRTHKPFVARRGTFVSYEPLEDSSYGDNVTEMLFYGKNAATDKDVVRAARDCNVSAKNIKNAYEFLSPNLVGTHITTDDAEKIISRLEDLGFDHAVVTDFVTPRSVVLFSEDQVSVIKVKKMKKRIKENNRHSLSNKNSYSGMRNLSKQTIEKINKVNETASKSVPMGAGMSSDWPQFNKDEKDNRRMTKQQIVTSIIDDIKSVADNASSINEPNYFLNSTLTEEDWIMQVKGLSDRLAKYVIMYKTGKPVKNKEVYDDDDLGDLDF